jgi:hypothetical protein
MQDGEDDYLGVGYHEIDTVRKATRQRAANLPMNQLIAERILDDPRETLVNAL